jgi:flagellar hook-length control protein FliK
MPQLNAAPSPSPVVAALTSAKAASADPSAKDIAQAAPEQPFANVLRQQQMKQQAAPAKEAQKQQAPDPLAKTADQPPGTSAPEASATNDIALIAQMLPGIAPVSKGSQPDAEAAPTDDTKEEKTDSGNSADTIVIAAAGMLGQPTPPPVVPKQEPATDAAAPAALHARSGAAAAAAEKLAAAEAGEPASRAASAAATEQGPDFAALVATSREQSTAASAQQVAASHTPAAAATVAEHIQTPVGARGWDSEVGNKLTWMVSKHETRADLVLNPPELGRIEVSISMNGDQANANFVSASATVRDAIENAMPRLREVLQDAGITLGQTQVGAESFQQPPGSRENGDNSSRHGTPASAGAESLAGTAPLGSAAAALRTGNGMVDTFA